MPGFVDELVEHSMRADHHPNRTFSFAGALALLAHLAGRKFVGPNDARPNIYLIALCGFPPIGAKGDIQPFWN